MVRAWFAVFGLCLTLALSGCSTWAGKGFEDPQVQVLKIEKIKLKLTHQEFRLHLRIDNPNDSSLPVRGLRYKLWLNDILLVDDEYSDWFVVDAHDHKTIHMRVRTNLWQHARDIAVLLRHPDQPVHYRIEGRIKSGFLFGKRVRIQRSGEIIPGVLIPE